MGERNPGWWDRVFGGKKKPGVEPSGSLEQTLPLPSSRVDAQQTLAASTPATPPAEEDSTADAVPLDWHVGDVIAQRLPDQTGARGRGHGLGVPRLG